MNKVKLTAISNITTGKLDSNAAVENGIYPYFTCAPEPLHINEFVFDCDAILLAGNNASGNFHCQRYKGKFNAYQRTYVITAKEGYDIDYIYYNLLISLQNLKKVSQGSQTKFLTMQILDSFEIENVEIDKQIGISKILANLDKKIRLNTEINSELELMAKTIYDYWFLQYDFPDENGKPYKSSGGKMVWNEELKREIPVGWEVSDLSYLCDITMGSSPQGESFNELGEGDIFYQGKTDFGQRFPNVRLYTTAPIRLAQEGDVLLSVRAPVGDINIASGRCCIGRGLAALHSEYKSFLYYTMLCNQYQFNKYNNSGTTFGAITKDALYTIKVVIPHSKLVSLFEKRVGKYDEKILKSFKENEEFISLRNFLLPLLMNGQVGFKVER